MFHLREPHPKAFNTSESIGPGVEIRPWSTERLLVKLSAAAVTDEDQAAASYDTLQRVIGTRDDLGLILDLTDLPRLARDTLGSLVVGCYQGSRHLLLDQGYNNKETLRSLGLAGASKLFRNLEDLARSYPFELTPAAFELLQSVGSEVRASEAAAEEARTRTELEKAVTLIKAALGRTAAPLPSWNGPTVEHAYDPRSGTDLLTTKPKQLSDGSVESRQFSEELARYIRTSTHDVLLDLRETDYLGEDAIGAIIGAQAELTEKRPALGFTVLLEESSLAYKSLASKQLHLTLDLVAA